MFYRPQSHNPDKHKEMPDAFPWCVSSEQIDNSFIEISEEDYQTLVNSIDLTAYNRAIQLERNDERQKYQREVGELLVKDLIDMMGARNLTLIQDGIAVNITTLASDNAGIKLLIETGALSTARTASYYYRSKYTHHADIYNYVIEKITNALTEMGYE